MAKWRDKDLDQLFADIKKENDEMLEMQVRGWGALGELYLEQYNQLGDFHTKLSEVWTSKGADAYMTHLDEVKESLWNSYEKAYGNAIALHRIGSEVGALQHTLESLVIEFEKDLDSAWTQYYKDKKDYEENSHDLIPGFDGDNPDEPNRAKLLEEKGYNTRAGNVLGPTMQSIHDTWMRDFWYPDPYTGPLNSQMPSGLGPGGISPPGVPGGPGSISPPPVAPMVAPPPAPTPPNIGTPPNVRNTPPAPTPPPIDGPQLSGPPTAPAVPTAPGAPTAPGIGEAPVAPVVGAPNAPGISPTTNRPAAINRPGISAPSGTESPFAPGKPGAGRMAPPPSMMGPKGAAKPTKNGRPNQPGSLAEPENELGIPGKPGTGQTAPPPGTLGTKGAGRGLRPGKPGRPGVPGGSEAPGTPMGGKPGTGMPPQLAGKGGAKGGKPGATKPGTPPGGKGQFPPTPHLGGPRREDKKPNPHGTKDMPPGMTPGLPGRVRSQGGTPPVMMNPGAKPPSTPGPRGLGVPRSLAPRTKRPYQGSEDMHGVIKPAEEKPVQTHIPRTVRDEKKLRERMQDPYTAERITELHKLAGLPAPVIDVPAPPRPQEAGPVLGYRSGSTA
jgi:hypothetical protein